MINRINFNYGAQLLSSANPGNQIDTVKKQLRDTILGIKDLIEERAHIFFEDLGEGRWRVYLGDQKSSCNYVRPTVKVDGRDLKLDGFPGENYRRLVGITSRKSEGKKYFREVLEKIGFEIASDEEQLKFWGKQLEEDSNWDQVTRITGITRRKEYNSATGQEEWIYSTKEALAPLAWHRPLQMNNKSRNLYEFPNKKICYKALGEKRTAEVKGRMRKYLSWKEVVSLEDIVKVWSALGLKFEDSAGNQLMN